MGRVGIPFLSAIWPLSSRRYGRIGTIWFVSSLTEGKEEQKSKYQAVDKGICEQRKAHGN